MFKIPTEINDIAKKLQASNFDAYLVGGSLRDLLLEKKPKDWDIATNAKPQEIQSIFPDSVYENNFGTVAVKTNSAKADLKIIEITTFRIESEYSDKRHPDKIKFAKTITTDLSRRDFTVNAMALKLPFAGQKSVDSYLTDPFAGRNDLKNKLIRTVGNPKDRFNEDALRIMRAVRLSTSLGFSIEQTTKQAIKKLGPSLSQIATERIRDEFIKIIMSPAAGQGLRSLFALDLLLIIFPELKPAVGCSQNKHHIYDVFEHSIRALEYAAQKNYNLKVRLAAFFHDIGKPKTKRGRGEKATFHAHEIIGAKMTKNILDRLNFSNDIIKDVTHLVRYHMFHYNVGEVSESGVRRFIARIGLEYLDDLLKVREADRIGSGVPKAFPYKLRHLLFMIDKVRRDPISPKSLNINGSQIMEILNIPPSPRVGMLLHALLEEIIEDPSLNRQDYLVKRAKDLNNLTDDQLKVLMKQAKQKQAEFEGSAESDLKKKHYIK